MTAMNKYQHLTEIPQASWIAMARVIELPERIPLSMALLALAVDPADVEGIIDSVSYIDDTRILFKSKNEEIRAPIGFDDFSDQGSKALDALKATLAQWSAGNGYTIEVVKTLTQYDIRIGTWCACAVAREAMSLRSMESDWMDRALSLAEAWVCGRSSFSDVYPALRKADEAMVGCVEAERYATDEADAAWGTVAALELDALQTEMDAYEVGDKESILMAETAMSNLAVAQEAAVEAQEAVVYSEYEARVTDAVRNALRVAVGIGAERIDCAVEAVGLAASAATCHLDYGSPEWNMENAKERERLLGVVTDALFRLPAPAPR
jgi:hypothetical protein